MSRKTLALLVGLLVITGILLALALSSSQKQPTTPDQQQPVVTEPSPVTSNAFTTLTMEPNPVTLTGSTGSVDVIMATDQNDVTAVQLELTYDPTVLSNVRVTPGEFFPNAQVLINQNDAQEGNLSYAIGIAPSQPTIKGTGVVATITFTARASTTGATTTELGFRPLTLVTAQGISESVLKEAMGATITLP